MNLSTQEFFQALLEKNIPRCKELVSKGLEAAIFHGQLSIVEALVNAGAGVNLLDKKGVSPLLRSTAEGHWEITRFLLSKGADANVSNKYVSVLFNAVGSNSPELVQDLIEAGANPNFVNFFGETPLTKALAEQSLPIVEVLVARGAQERPAGKVAQDLGRRWGGWGLIAFAFLSYRLFSFGTAVVISIVTGCYGYVNLRRANLYNGVRVINRQ